MPTLTERSARDQRVKELSRMSRVRLVDERKRAYRAKGWTALSDGASKDELIADILGIEAQS